MRPVDPYEPEPARLKEGECERCKCWVVINPEYGVCEECFDPEKDVRPGGPRYQFECGGVESRHARVQREDSKLTTGIATHRPLKADSSDKPKTDRNTGSRAYEVMEGVHSTQGVETPSAGQLITHRARCRRSTIARMRLQLVHPAILQPGITAPCQSANRPAIEKRKAAGMLTIQHAVTGFTLPTGPVESSAGNKPAHASLSGDVRRQKF